MTWYDMASEVINYSVNIYGLICIRCSYFLFSIMFRAQL
jgi:hypothetical protein